MITHIEKFGAEWCSPCRVLERTLEQITDIDVVKYDVDEDSDLASEKKIRSIPVLIFYNGDTEVDSFKRHCSYQSINFGISIIKY